MNEKQASEDQPRSLIYVDILGFAATTNQYKVRVRNFRDEESGFSGASTTEMQGQINRFNTVLDQACWKRATMAGFKRCFFGGDDGTRTRGLCRDSGPLIGFTTTYKTGRGDCQGPPKLLRIKQDTACCGLDCGLRNSSRAIQPNRSTMTITSTKKPTFRPSDCCDVWSWTTVWGNPYATRNRVFERHRFIALCRRQDSQRKTRWLPAWANSGGCAGA